jgi:signal transduction histidine kinase
VLWAIRDAGEVVDFAFGYGNPAMVNGFRIPAETPNRYTLLEALPRMRGSRAFDGYVDVCERGEPWVSEVTYDTPFGDGYMLGTFVHRAARLGDGVIVFLHDVTASRRMEAELVAYADVVAHDLSAPLAGIALLVKVLELRPDEPPAPDVLQELRATSDRARELVDGVLDYARSGELVLETFSLRDVTDAVAADLRPQLAESGGTARRRRPPGGSRRSAAAATGHAEPRRERAEVPRRGPAPRRGRCGPRPRGVGRDRAGQRHRNRPRERASHLRHVLPCRAAGGGKRDRARGLPARRRGPRRADLGGAAEGGGSAFHFTLPFDG